MSAGSIPSGVDDAVHASESREAREKILAGLNISIPTTRPSFGYRMAIALLATFLVLLSLTFAALVAFMLYLVLWHGYNAFASMGQGPYFIFHMPMALLGGLLLIYLIKPFITRVREAKESAITLDRRSEPLLFEFVDRLCAATGSKSPDVIEVDCEANASASFKKGISSVLTRKLVLRIGLPLVAAMDVQKLAGVLAHEFGHFNQKSGMFGSLMIRRLMFFFVRVVFQRGKLDEYLTNLKARRSFWYYVAAIFIEPARGVLWLMLLIGELLTRNAMRRMEYDADTFEARLAGSQSFARTSEMIFFLNLAMQQSKFDLSRSYAQQRLADDLPLLVFDRAKRLQKKRGEILKHLTEEKTGWLDTHPCHNDRVRAAESLEAAGLFTCATPARRLFSNFSNVCKNATQSVYRSLLSDQELGKVKLIPTVEIVCERESESGMVKAVRRFFRGSLVATRPVYPEDSPMVVSFEDTFAELSDLRQQLEVKSPTVAKASQSHEDFSVNVAAARSQLELVSIFRDNPKVDRLRMMAVKQLDTNRPQLEALMRDLTAYEGTARRRLSLALSLLETPELAEAFGPDAIGKVKAEVAKYRDVCRQLAPVGPRMEQLRESAISLDVLMSAYNDQQPFPPLVNRILKTTSDMNAILSDTRHDLHSIAYPFEHGTPGISIGDALIPEIADSRDPSVVYAAGHTAYERYVTLHYRVLGSLVEIAVRIETAAGLVELPEMPETELEENPEEKVEAKKMERRYWIGFSFRAAAGVLMLFVLVYYSINPPELPNMPWAERGQVAYRPAGFRVTGSGFDSYHPPVINFNSTPGMGPTFKTYAGMPQGPQYPMQTSPGNFVAPSMPGFPQFQTYGSSSQIPGQPGYVGNMGAANSRMPGQPGYTPPPFPGQPGYNPTPFPGQPGYNPSAGVPGSPGYNPGAGSPSGYRPPSTPTYSPPSYSPPSPGGGFRGGGGSGMPSPGGGGGGRPR